MTELEKKNYHRFYRIKKFCKNSEAIENYDKWLQNPGKYDCHHRLETHNSDGSKRIVPLTRDELIAFDIYYNRPAEELIFLTKSEHQIIHFTGSHHSNDWKLKQSISNRNSPKQKRVFYRCIETDEVHCKREWVRLGFTNVHTSVKRN